MMTGTIPYRLKKWAMSMIMLCFFITCVHSQTVSKSILSSGGQYHENSGIHLQWTLGEITIDRRSVNNIIVEEGFHAGHSISLSTNVNIIRDFPLKIYPNPTEGLIYIEGENWWGQMHYTISSLGGQIVLTGFKNFMSPIEMHELSPGIYIIHAINSKGENYRAKIVKI